MSNSFAFQPVSSCSKPFQKSLSSMMSFFLHIQQTVFGFYMF